MLSGLTLSFYLGGIISIGPTQVFVSGNSLAF